MVDVIKRLRSPMRVDRVKLSVRVTINGLIILLVCISTQEKPGIESSHVLADYLVLTSMLLFLVLATFTIISFIFMMNMLGLGVETKKKIMRRQMSLVLAYTICNLLPSFVRMSWYGVCHKDHDCYQDFFYSWYGYILKWLYYSQGFVFAITRILEPGSFKLHISNLRRVFCCRSNSTRRDCMEPINLLFNSTLNIEFVYVILEGIVKFSRMGMNDLDGNNEMEFIYS